MAQINASRNLLCGYAKLIVLVIQHAFLLQAAVYIHMYVRIYILMYVDMAHYN